MTPEQLGEEHRAFWAERSHADSKSVNDHARAAVQTLILINGGAATTLLAFATRTGTSSISSNVMLSIGLFCYVIGAAIGAYNIRILTDTGNAYLDAWNGIAVRESESIVRNHLDNARYLSNIGRNCFSMSLGLFLVGSFVLGIGVMIGRSI